VQVFHEVFTSHGLPVTIYGDRTGILHRNDRHWSIDEQLEGRQRSPQGARMLEELGVGYIPAQSPQAKGRVERNHGTYQDRFVKELFLEGIHEHVVIRVILQFTKAHLDDLTSNSHQSIVGASRASADEDRRVIHQYPSPRTASTITTAR
jgi:hypothetical protein